MEPNLARSFYLLSLNPKNGYYFNTGPEFQYGLTGSIVADLYFQQRVRIEKRTLYAVDPAPTNYSFFDRPLQTIEQKGGIRIASLLGRMGFRPGWYKKELIRVLLANGDLVQVPKKFLGIPYNRYFPGKSDERLAMIRRLRDILLRGEHPEGPELMLLSLVPVCRLYRAITERGAERKRARQNLKNLLKNGTQYSRQFGDIEALTKGIKGAIMAAHASHSAGH
ncbi:MAG TPA: GPP34 family phosphoprotein [Prolixibacteraceae bacterium]|nr:GPP34 family phosphoprotein [Prolixibacteraceae bacterium]